MQKHSACTEVTGQLARSILPLCVSPEDLNQVVRDSSKRLYLRFHHLEPHSLFSNTTGSQLLLTGSQPGDRCFVPSPISRGFT